ncbi:winged helix-turn-helix transcriptional regulator [Halomonas heilongjiangensis]|uniref:Transcriptional regulator n=1 Tax=Halomonas heilongjiangensis TaxID=1387883 RepID=A0A2N7TFL9_9GAMM|nr:helix-turn-helix domain-containing protein [Halomonas heilongjiangensis]PMR66994.1 transcriptional regulator [Halomonas heilongjiangensis]PXX88090.1 transcriptional regulator [Halomonas heilongjiangensis]
MNDDTNPQQTTSEHTQHNGILAKDCPFERLGGLLGGAWTLQVLWLLGEGGPLRFGNLRTSIEGVSPKVLTERLRRMENDGLVWRRYERQVPPKATYGLTEVGMELHCGIKQISKIADKLPPER